MTVIEIPRNAEIVQRDVKITNPDGQQATMSGGFTVEKGGEKSQ